MSARGFTFVELLASMLFIAIVIPVCVQGLTISNRLGLISERKRIAADLANNLLSELILTEAWRDSTKDGDFGIEWPGYRWALNEQAWEEDSLRLLTVTVFFIAQEKEYSVSLSTLVNESEEEGAVSEEATEEATAQ